MVIEIKKIILTKLELIQVTCISMEIQKVVYERMVDILDERKLLKRSKKDWQYLHNNISIERLTFSKRQMNLFYRKFLW